MDINTLRSLTTLLMFVVFLGIVAWAWKGSRRQEFEAAARLPFEDDLPGAGAQGEKQ
jgi:cytochrome c oxidase cbb3-type subunit 4